MRKISVAIALVALICGGNAAAGQSGSIPGRDLLAYPIGLLAEPASLPGAIGIGLYNPAAASLPEKAKWRLSVAAMNTPADIGASAQAFGVATTVRGATLSASVVRASVGGLVRTDSDPLTIANDVPYSTLLASVGAAHEFRKHVHAGVALRGRWGRLDLDRRAGAAVDVGVVAEHLQLLDARVGAAAFLAHTGQAAADPPTWLASTDARLAGRDTARTIRVGASASATARRPSEQFAFVSARFDRWEMRVGSARTTAYGSTNTRLRLGVAVRHAGYIVGVSREESPSGLAPSYQFVLSSVIP